MSCLGPYQNGRSFVGHISKYTLLGKGFCISNQIWFLFLVGPIDHKSASDHAMDFWQKWAIA